MQTDQSEFMKLGAKTRIGIGIHREAVMKIIGEFSLFSIGKYGNEKLISKNRNDVGTLLLNESAKGCATGTFLAIDKMNFIDTTPADHVEVTSKVAGGTGAEDYVTFEATYTNSSGVTKTIKEMELGDDLGGGGEKIYCTKDITDQEVLDGNSLKCQWKITMALDSGDLASAYRYRFAQMLNSGTFVVGDKMNFIDTVPADHKEVASLNDGGTGAEAYHEWVATYSATGSVTIDKVYYIKDGDADYVTSNITNKALSNGESITAYTKIQHSSA